MKETIKLGLVLLLITAISGGVLAVSNNITAPIIAEIEKAGSFGAFGEIFPEADDFVAIDEGKLAEIMAENRFVLEVYEAKSGDEIIGYAFKTKSGGFGGDIFMISGISMDSTLTGIRVVEMGETPGLGARIVDEPSFQESFVGKSIENELVATEAHSGDNEVMLLSGATVSTEGVLFGVNGAREAFLKFLTN